MAKETTFPSTFSNLVFGFLLIFTFHSQVLRAFQQYGDKCNQTTTCSSPNLTCSQNQTCACSSDFVTDYSNPGNIVCVKKSDYGEVCPAGDFNPCYSDTTCTPDVNGINRCLCDRSFYRTNFNTCSSMDELSPSKISATSTTNTVTLTWTADKHGMDVTYTVISNQGQGQLVGSVTDTGAIWSNLTSGRKYSFNITTTLPSDNYYPVKVMQVYKGDVWTEPAIPGPVMSVTLISGTPGADYMYSVTFQGSQGDVNHYSININNDKVDVTGTTSIFSTLKPGQNYSYALTSYNGINNPSQVFTGTFKTNVTDPGVILNLTVQQDAIIARVLNISFFCPDAKAFPGNIQGYTIQKTLFDGQQVAEETPYRFVASHSACGASFSDSDVKGVFVERDYSFSVRAWNDFYVGNFTPAVEIYIAAKVPRLDLLYDISKIITKVDNTQLGNTKIEVLLNTGYILDANQGAVTDVGIAVCVKSANILCTNIVIDNLDNLKTWDYARHFDFNVVYRTTPSDWFQTLQSQPSQFSYIIGGDNCTSLPTTTFCNGELPAGKELALILVQCNSAGCGQVIYNNYYTPIVAGTDNNNLALGLGIGLGLGCLLLAAVILAVVIYYKRRRRLLRRKREMQTIQPREDKPNLPPNPPPHFRVNNGTTADYIVPIGNLPSDYFSAPSLSQSTHTYKAPEDEVIYDYIGDDYLTFKGVPDEESPRGS